MRARADQRQVALEHHVEELRQFVDAGLADEAADAGDARIVLGDALLHRMVGHVGAERAEFVDLNQFVVEAVTALLEEHRAAAVQLDGDGDQQHQRRRANKRNAADDFVEQIFHHHVPVGDRPVEYVEHRNVAEIGVGAGAEAQLVGMCREPDVDRQHPQLLEHLQDAAFGHDRQREDHEVDTAPPRELDQVIHRAELSRAGFRLRRAVVAAVVKQADHANVGITLIPHRLGQRFAGFAAADDGGAPRQPAFLGPAPDHDEQPAA